MRKLLLSAAVALAFSANALDTADYVSTFTAADGFVYGVVDEGFGTCEVAFPNYSGDLAEYGNQISGDVVIPEYVTNPSNSKEYMVIGIGNSAFYYADAQYDQYWNMTLPSTILTIDNYAFMHCELLKNITLGEAVVSIGYSSFSHCFELDNVKFPETLESIDEWAFYGNQTMTKVILPESLLTIGSYAFCGPRNGSGDDGRLYGSIEKFVVGPNVEKLEGRVLGYQDNLQILVLNFPEPPTNESSNLFSNTDVTKTTIYVPDASLDAYKACDDWNNNYSKWQFKGIRPMSELDPTPVTLAFPEESYTVELNEEFTLPALTITPAEFAEEAQAYVVYSVSGTDGIAEVSEGGTSVTFSCATAGTVTVTASLSENDDYAAEPVSFVLVVKDPVVEEPDQPEDPDSGVDVVLSSDAPMAVYNLSGSQVGTSVEGLAPGIYIIRQAGKSLKVVVK